MTALARFLREAPRPASQPLSRRALGGDLAFLGALVALSVVPYLSGLGFYSDDWSFLGYLHNADDPSLLGRYRAAISPGHAMRPAFVGYLALLYDAFGLEPLGYHLVNAATLAAGAALLYLAGLRFLPRPVALAVAAVFITLPHYSTIRFWVVALPIALSFALYAASLYADLRAVEATRGARWGWKGAAVASLVVSLLAYELFLPLFVLNIALAEVHLRRRQEHETRGPARWALHGSTLAALGAVAVFKAATTTRLYDMDPLWHARWFARLLRDSALVGFGDYGVELPWRVATVLSRYATGPMAVVAVLVAALVFAWLYRVTRGGDGVSARKAAWLVLAGGFVFGLGYALFLTNANAFVHPTGIANRIAFAGSIGVAMVFVGVLWGISTLVPHEHWRRGGFAAGVAILCASGVLILNALATFWVTSYDEQLALLHEIRQRLPDLPPGSTLVLDGVCPYRGPAIVFESNWDLAGLLMVHYGDTSLQADVTTANLTAEEDGLQTVLYGSISARHPYGDRLLVYHAGLGEAYPLPDADAARHYFEEVRPELSCPPGEAGYGVDVF